MHPGAEERGLPSQRRWPWERRGKPQGTGPGLVILGAVTLLPVQRREGRRNILEKAEQGKILK